MRAYRKKAMGEGKFGKGQQLHLMKLDENQLRLQELGQRYMVRDRRQNFIAWLQQCTPEAEAPNRSLIN